MSFFRTLVRSFATKQDITYTLTTEGHFRTSHLCSWYLQKQSRMCKNVRLVNNDYCHCHQHNPPVTKSLPADAEQEFFDQSHNPLKWAADN